METRVAVLEAQHAHVVDSVGRLERDLRDFMAETRRRQDEQDEKLDSIRKATTGVLAGVVVAAIMLAVNAGIAYSRGATAGTLLVSLLEVLP